MVLLEGERPLAKRFPVAMFECLSPWLASQKQDRNWSAWSETPWVTDLSVGSTCCHQGFSSRNDAFPLYRRLPIQTALVSRFFIHESEGVILLLIYCIGRHQNQKPQVEICSLKINFLKQNSKGTPSRGPSGPIFWTPRLNPGVLLGVLISQWFSVIGGKNQVVMFIQIPYNFGSDFNDF